MPNTRQPYSSLTVKHLCHFLILFLKAFNYTQSQCQVSCSGRNRNPQLLMICQLSNGEERESRGQPCPHCCSGKKPQFALALGSASNMLLHNLLYSPFSHDKTLEDHPCKTVEPNLSIPCLALSHVSCDPDSGPETKLGCIYR